MKLHIDVELDEADSISVCTFNGKEIFATFLNSGSLVTLAEHKDGVIRNENGDRVGEWVVVRP